MVAIDKFGFRLGSKRSAAATLYEGGATQADMVAATGTTQYNMLKDAERRGHRVEVKGDRYWLIASGEIIRPVRSLRKEASPVGAAKFSLRPSVARVMCTIATTEVVAAPTVVSVIGWHGNESPEAIVARKIHDIDKVGLTFWVFQSWKAKTQDVQEFGCRYPGATVHFIEGGAFPAGTSQSAKEVSEDGRNWATLPGGIGEVTGKLRGGTALVLDKLEPCSASIDLWAFAEYPSAEPLRFMRGASTACVTPASGGMSGMKSRYRRVVAIGRMSPPYGVYLR